MRWPRRRGSGGGKSSDASGTDSESSTPATGAPVGGASRRKARFRLRLPKVQSPKPPKGRSDLWFRFVTRLKAIGYWLREKAQALRGLSKRGAERAAHWWSRQSREARISTYAVAGVIVLYLIVKFIPVPGVPCQVSAAKECPPSNDTIAFVPESAAMYAHVTVNSDSHQAELADDLRDLLPNFISILQESTRALPSPSGRTIDVASSVLPFAKDDLGLIAVPGPEKTTSSAYVVGVEDQERADEFIASIAPAGTPTQADQQGSPLTVYGGGFATAESGDQLLFGGEAAVRAALDAEAGRGPTLEDSDQDAARDALPDVRLAEVYLSPVGVRRYLVGRAGGATQLDTFVDYGATTGMAASATLKDGGVEVNLVSELDPKLEQQSPTVFADLPEFKPSLADEVGPRAIGYAGVGDLGPALNRALVTAGAGARGLVGSLRALAQRLRREASVDPLEDLLPALGGQAALVAEPTDSVPFATLIVEGVDETKASEALAALQGPILRSIGTGGPRVPAFETTEERGVTVYSVQVSATVNLSYAVFDRKLVVSTQPAGITQALSGDGGLADTSTYEDATGELPDSVSALVFVNLEELLGLPPLQESLAVNALYASLSEDISRIGSLGVAVRGSEEELRSELFMAIDD